MQKNEYVFCQSCVFLLISTLEWKQRPLSVSSNHMKVLLCFFDCSGKTYHCKLMSTQLLCHVDACMDYVLCYLYHCFSTLVLRPFSESVYSACVFQRLWNGFQISSQNRWVASSNTFGVKVVTGSVFLFFLLSTGQPRHHAQLYLRSSTRHHACFVFSDCAQGSDASEARSTSLLFTTGCLNQCDLCPM